MANKIQFRRDIRDNWISVNPILSDGELGFEKDTGLFKIGNGVKTWMELSYNTGNNGLFDVALLSTINNDPSAAPSDGNMLVYSAKIANRAMLKFMGPSGLSTSVQPLLARNKIGYWCPQGNAVTVPGVLGYTAQTAIGTATLRIVTTANLFNRMRRLGYVSLATAGSSCGSRVAVAQVTLSDGNNQGGFFKVCRFGISDPIFVQAGRCFVGVASSTGVLSNVEPSTYVNCIGMGSGIEDQNMKIFYGGTISQPPIDLGPDFPINASNTDVYELALFAAPNDTGVNWQVTRLNTGHTAVGYIANTNPSVTLPTQNTLLTYHTSVRTNGATAAIVGIDIMSDYIETDY